MLCVWHWLFVVWILMVFAWAVRWLNVMVQIHCGWLHLVGKGLVLVGVCCLSCFVLVCLDDGCTCVCVWMLWYLNCLIFWGGGWLRESWSKSGVIGVQSGLCGTDSLSFPLSLHCAMLVSFQLTQGSVIGFLAFFFFSLDLRLLKMKLEFRL